MSKIIIGTAAFGSSYGIKNGNEYTGGKEVAAIISEASKLGIRNYDTAPAYGSAESLIGKLLQPNKANEISSKIGNLDDVTVESITRSVRNSLVRVNSESLWCLYLHDPVIYLNPKLEIYRSALIELRDQGLIQNIGISVYNQEEAVRNLESFNEIDLVQIPENICDRRLLESDFFQGAIKQGIKIVLRSIFLQGLLLMDASKIPINLRDAQKSINEIEKKASEFGLLNSELCLAYAKSIGNIEGVIIGVSKNDQLVNLSKDYSNLPKGWYENIPRLPEKILDPRLWK